MNLKTLILVALVSIFSKSAFATEHPMISMFENIAVAQGYNKVLVSVAISTFTEVEEETAKQFLDRNNVKLGVACEVASASVILGNTMQVYTDKLQNTLFIEDTDIIIRGFNLKEKVVAVVCKDGTRLSSKKR